VSPSGKKELTEPVVNERLCYVAVRLEMCLPRALVTTSVFDATDHRRARAGCLGLVWRKARYGYPPSNANYTRLAHSWLC